MEYLDRPTWSAFREPSFGHGLLSLENSTHAQWRWHRNQVLAAALPPFGSRVSAAFAHCKA